MEAGRAAGTVDPRWTELATDEADAATVTTAARLTWIAAAEATGVSMTGVNGEVMQMGATLTSLSLSWTSAGSRCML